jgi:hypothetical protein
MQQEAVIPEATEPEATEPEAAVVPEWVSPANIDTHFFDAIPGPTEPPVRMESFGSQSLGSWAFNKG